MRAVAHGGTSNSGVHPLSDPPRQSRAPSLPARWSGRTRQAVALGRRQRRGASRGHASVEGTMLTVAPTRPQPREGSTRTAAGICWRYSEAAREAAGSVSLAHTDLFAVLAHGPVWSTAGGAGPRAAVRRLLHVIERPDRPASASGGGRQSRRRSQVTTPHKRQAASPAQAASRQCRAHRITTARRRSGPQGPGAAKLRVAQAAYEVMYFLEAPTRRSARSRASGRGSATRSSSSAATALWNWPPSH